MATYTEQISARYTARSHHSFILHGATRDLQLGDNGSCSLVDHIVQSFSKSEDSNASRRLVVTYRVGIGWRFALDSDRAEFSQLTGVSGNAGDFAGLTTNNKDDDLPLDAPSAIGLIDIALRQDKRALVIVLDRAELIAPNGSYDRMSPSDKAVLSILCALACDPAVESSGNLLILITDTLLDLSEPLRLASGRYYAIEILPPEYKERLAIADQVFAQLSGAGVSLELSSKQFAQATSMLTRYGLMDVLQDAASIGSLTKDLVKTVKAQVMAQEYGDVLETLDPLANGYDGIAGQSNLKALWATIIEDMIAGNFQDVPAGLLFAGAAGLGKSLFMRAVAGDSGLPVINFNIGRLLGSFVGQSERNLERALTAIKSAAPCIVVLDEIETTFPDRASAGPSGDSGVGSRILKRMLEELSNPANRGLIVWVGITNYPNKLDAALSRAGRFDLTVAFLPPVEKERVDLINLFCRKYDVMASAPEVMSCASSLAGYTNAEIENVVRKVRQLQKTLGVAESWLESPKRVRANTRDVAMMTNLALASVNDSDQLPEEYIDQWRRLTNQTNEDASAKTATNGTAGNPRKLF